MANSGKNCKHPLDIRFRELQLIISLEIISEHFSSQLATFPSDSIPSLTLILDVTVLRDTHHRSHETQEANRQIRRFRRERLLRRDYSAVPGSTQQSR